MNKLNSLFGSGKNSKLKYYIISSLRGLVPSAWLQHRLPMVLQGVENRSDKLAIEDRVNYYNRLPAGSFLPNNAPKLQDFRKKGHRSVYYYDTYEYVRWFPKHYRWCYVFGDVREVPEVPSIVKSRPLVAENANSVVLNLNKVRHFIFLKDPIPFRAKQNRVIFRGEVDGKLGRLQFMERWYGHPMCDLGDVSSKINNPLWMSSKRSIYEHLDYKFIMALEGNDVASNLKWVMSSNSLAVMPPPCFETWFMEGRLIPNYHYVAIKPDFSDLEERLQYYIDHPEEAEQIIQHAHEWVDQFKDPMREKLISLLVLDRYFCRNGQK